MKKNSRNNRIELLSPAGGPEQYKAAVNAGADAVYVGGSMFNARIGAGNFTLDELEEAVDYGHLRGVKTYVTMNTLMSDKDVRDGVEYAKKLYAMGVDALIIQDLGLGLAIRETLPDFELHLSTQATVFNPEGVFAASKLGYRRVVLARECSLEEIRDCVKPNDSKALKCDTADWPEIEVFVHGALCMCYSGQCQLSRFIGGRSGNKGMCAQPCRLPYKYFDIEGKKIKGQYPLSPKDLSMIDNIGEMIDMGVASLKIEGRMKSAEYVAVVTSIYRKYIDSYYENGRYTVSEEDRNKLEQIFNRGGFTEGYAHKDPDGEILSGSSPKNQGVYLGRVSKTYKSGPYLEIEADNKSGLKPEMQDVLEIRPSYGENVSYKVTYLEKLGHYTYKTGDLRDKVLKGDQVYRIVSETLKSEVSAIIKDGKKLQVAMTLVASSKSPLKLTIREKESGVSVVCDSGDFIPEEARAKDTTVADIIKQLSKTGETSFEASDIKVIMDEALFIPVSKLNELRRDGLSKFETVLIKSFKRVELEQNGDSKKALKQEINKQLMYSDETYKMEESDLTKKTTTSNQLSENIIADKAQLIDEENILVLPHVTKGNYDVFLKEKSAVLQDKVESYEGKAIANNISQFVFMDGGKVKIVGGRGLNITNFETVRAYQKLGMSDEYLVSSELLEKDDMDGVPLMITEHRMIPGKLVDRKGSCYAVEYNEDMHKTFIFAIKEKS